MYAYELTRMQKESIMVAKKIAAVPAPITTSVFTNGVYRTRNGRKATILANGVPGDFCLIGFVESKNNAITPTTWRSDGRAAIETNDLLTVWNDIREITIDLYVGLDDSGAAVISYSPPKTDDFIGLKKITVTVKEGERLHAEKD